MNRFTTYMHSPIGWICLQATDTYLSKVFWVSDAGPERDENHSDILSNAIQQLNEYFAGERAVFELPLKQEGTSFQQKVWNELVKIPYGETITYQNLATRTGSPKACRAVGSANGKNNIFIIVPCHRVIQTGGKIGGYAYGPEMKQFLLELEQKRG